MRNDFVKLDTIIMDSKIFFFLVFNTVIYSELNLNVNKHNINALCLETRL